MAIELLKTENLNKVDGGVVAAVFDALLKEVALDCKNRPGDGTARKVELCIEMKPECDQSGACDKVNLEFTFGLKLPKRRSRVINMGIKATGGLTFNPNSPDNVDQKTLLE